MELEKKTPQNHCRPSLQHQLYRFGLRVRVTFVHIFMTFLLCTFAQFSTLGQQRSSWLWYVSRLTNSAVMVRQGQCFLVSLTLMALAFWVVFRALDKLSGVTSRQISLSSEEKPSIWYSSKKLAWREKDTLKRSSVGDTTMTNISGILDDWWHQVSRTPTCESSHHMLTPPLVTFPDRTKNRLSGVSRRVQLLVSFEMVLMTPIDVKRIYQTSELLT